jgi:ATP-dependent protease ClpP protease subunit
VDKENLPEIETRLEVKNQTNEDSPAELFIYGRIRQAFPWENEDDDTHISAKAVKDKLNEVANDKELNVHVNSPGGEVFESIAIRNLLVQHEGEVKIIIDGLAGSGASFIATAGHVVMFKSSMQMIHKAWGMCIGNADDMIKMAEDLEKIDDSILASYMEKFVGEEEELKDLMAEETWLTAKEALTLGLADEIWEDEDVEDDEDEEEEPQGSVKENLFLKYQNKTKKNKKSKPDNKESGLFNIFKNN